MENKTFNINPGLAKAFLKAALETKQTLETRRKLAHEMKIKKHGGKNGDRKRTKRGARHYHGNSFTPRTLIKYQDKPMTPATYRRLHLGNQKKEKTNGPTSN